MGEGRREWKKELKDFGDISDPKSIAALSQEYTDWMLERNYSKLTAKQKSHHLRRFIDWCLQRDITRPHTVTKPILERYQKALYNYKRDNGSRLSFKTQRCHLVTVQVFFRWLCRMNLLLSNPASDLELPKTEIRLPTGVLTQSEIESVLNQTDVTDIYGLRDRAAMETLYSTGVRRAELVKICMTDLDMEGGTVFVNQGKGRKDRVVPIGERALSWIDKYLVESRLMLSINLKEESLFLNNKGESLTSGGLSNIVKAYIQSAGIQRSGACHLFRHTMATSMLENGADIRYIQEILGHAKLETTQIYTQVSIQKLKAVHAKTHPAKPYREKNIEKQMDE